MKILTLVLISLVLVGCSQVESQKASSGCSEEQACAAAETTQSAQLEPISFDDAIRFFTDKKSGLLYFGFENCPWCQEAVPVLEEAAWVNDIPIHYIQTRDAEGTLLYTDKQKEEILPYIKNYMSNNDEGVLTLYVPLVLVIRDGEVAAGHVGTVDDHDAHERTMTEEEKQELMIIYEKMIDQLKNGE